MFFGNGCLLCCAQAAFGKPHHKGGGVIRARWERGQELDAKVFLQEASTINRQCHYRR